MPEIEDDADETFRDYEVDGVPSSGPNDPAKADIRALFTVVDTEVAAAGVFAASTWAKLSGLTPPNGVGSQGFVFGPDAGTHTDPVTAATGVANVGVYAYETSPATGWQWLGALPSAIAEQWADLTGATVDGMSLHYSAEEWAVGTAGRGVTGAGSAKDWAIRTGGTVDGAEYSAKDYAIGTDVDGLTGKGSAKAWAAKASGSPDGSSNLSALQYATAAAASATAAAASAASIGAPLTPSGAQLIGRPVAPAAGTAYGGGDLIWADPIRINGTLSELLVYCTAGTITVKVYNRSGNVLTLASTSAGISVSSGLNTLTTALGTIAVRSGQYIGTNGPVHYITPGVLSDGAGYWTAAGVVGLPTKGNVQLQATFQFAGKLDLLADPVAEFSSISLENVDRIFTISNSYYQGIGQLKGKICDQILSALTEYNFANYSVSGATIAALAQDINIGANPTVGGAAINLQSGSTHANRIAFLSETTNSFTNGENLATYTANFQGAINVSKGLGALPVVVTQFGGVSNPTIDGEQSAVKLLRNLANQNDVPFIDVASKSAAMNVTQYAPFWYAGHPSTRQVYLMIDRLRYAMKQVLPRPLRSMKIFRVRGTVSVSVPTDLNFRTIAQRHHLFKELYLDQHVLTDATSNLYDALTTGSPIFADVTDEYVAMNKGTSVSLGTWALIDCVLPVTNAKGVSLTLSDTSITVYARQLNYDGSISWLQLEQVGGLYVVPDGQGAIDLDRVAFLLSKGGGISLNASPLVAWMSGKPRRPVAAGLLYPPQGAEMLTQPLTVVSAAIPVQWTNTGSLAISAPTDAVYPDGCTGSVDVTASNGLSQTFTYPASDDPIEVVVRVWARNWVSVYSSSGATPPNGPITYETCDTGTLQCTLSGPGGINTYAAALMVDQVGLAWNEIEWRETLPANPTGTATVAIDVRSQDVNLAVAKVSVRAAF